eukprot:scaffold13134_cov69-Phaeocystis_antarctica.AAC.12
MNGIGRAGSWPTSQPGPATVGRRGRAVPASSSSSVVCCSGEPGRWSRRESTRSRTCIAVALLTSDCVVLIAVAS